MSIMPGRQVRAAAGVAPLNKVNLTIVKIWTLVSSVWRLYFSLQPDVLKLCETKVKIVKPGE